MSAKTNHAVGSKADADSFTIFHRVTPDQESYDILNGVLCYFAKRQSWSGAVTVMPLGRFGYTGAKLYQVHTNNGNYVVKVAPQKDIEVEAKNHDAALMQTLATKPCIMSENKQAILYSLHTSLKSSKKHSLQPTFYTPAKTVKEVIDDNLNLIVSQEPPAMPNFLLLDSIKKALNRLSSRNNTLSAQYTEPINKVLNNDDSNDTYFRSEAKSRHFINTYWSDVHHLLQSSKISGISPIKLYNIKDSISVMLYKRSIHGDLHGSNIMLLNKSVALIDFAWFRTNASFLIDYITLENSLRFMVNPLDVSQLTQAHISSQYTTLYLPTLTNSGKCAQKCWDALSVVNDSVNLIRSHAIAIARKHGSVDEYSFHRDYLITQFYILAGQLQYKDFDRFNAVMYLSMIAHKILEKRKGLSAKY